MQLYEQRILGLDVMIERPAEHTGLFANVPDGRAPVPLAGEKLRGDFLNLAATFACPVSLTRIRTFQHSIHFG
ncbi:hypothetical protein GCM10007897_23340 [Sphingobium jiangsuense]|nr:hypothetical protein GCM10007897_23340 [Sphingobium jiangsuense]